MANQSAVAKLWEKRAREAKEYKMQHDAERLHHLSAALVHLRDHTGAQAVNAAIARELSALNAKQQELDAKEKEEHDKENAEAVAADAKATAESKPEEEYESPSFRAPSVPRR